MARRCPQCRTFSRTHSTEELNADEWLTYHQCKNLYCGLCFVTHTAVIKEYTRQPKSQHQTTPGS